MAPEDQLKRGREAVLARWLEATLASYPKEFRALLKREKDRFASPVGHALWTGAEAALGALLEGRTAEEACSCLEEFIRIRAVQEFTPSRAVAFIFLLKEAVRGELGQEEGHGPFWAEFDAKIDRLGLAAFDIYMRNRETVYRLRVNEVKRSVSKIVERMNRKGPSSVESEGLLSEDLLRATPFQPEASKRDDAERGGGL